MDDYYYINIELELWRDNGGKSKSHFPLQFNWQNILKGKVKIETMCRIINLLTRLKFAVGN